MTCCSTHMTEFSIIQILRISPNINNMTNISLPVNISLIIDGPGPFVTWTLVTIDLLFGVILFLIGGALDYNKKLIIFR